MIRRGALWRVLSLLLVAVTVLVLFGKYGLNTVATEQWMDAHVRGQGLRGVLVYTALVALLTGVGVPRQICSFLGGYVFGMLQGTLWATVGTTLACIVCFNYARFLGQDWVQRRYGHRIAPLQNFICQSPFLLTVLIRIVPLGSNFLTNFLAGVSKIPALPFLSGSCCGFVIQNLIFAMLGSGLQISSGSRTALSAVLYMLSLSVGWWIYRRYRADQQNMKSCTPE